MHDYYISLKNALQQDIQLLSLVRITLDNPQDIVDLQQDILDLYNFPERLHGSYRKEWLHYCLPKLAAMIPDTVADDTGLEAWLSQSTNHFSPSAIKSMLAVIDHVQTTEQKLVPFPTPLRKYVYQLLRS